MTMTDSIRDALAAAYLAGAKAVGIDSDDSYYSEAATAFAASVELPIAPPSEYAELRKALEQCRDQFAFYAREHAIAGKIEKANTNLRFVQIAVAAILAERDLVSSIYWPAQ